MGFSAPIAGQHVYGSGSGPGSLGAFSAPALTNTPVAGDVLVCAIFWYNGSSPTPTFTVADNNGKTYTVTANSPSQVQKVNAGMVYLAYRIADGTEGKTVTATPSLSNGTLGGLFVAEFAVSGGTATFDQDAAGTGASGTTVNTPTVPVAGAGELVYAMAAPGHTLTAANSPWTEVTETEANGELSAYILSRGSNVALDMTQNVSGEWDSMGMSFAFAASGGTPFDWLAQRPEYPDKFRKTDVVASGEMPGRGI